MKREAPLFFFGVSPDNPGFSEARAVLVESYEDVEKRRREVYRVNHQRLNFRLLFYSPNEMPSPLPQADTAFIFGQQPKIRKKAEWEEFLSDSRMKIIAFGVLQEERDLNRYNRDRLVHNSLLVVESSPFGILQAARFLNPENRSLETAYRQIVHWGNPELSQEFIDHILAGKFIDSQGNFKKSPDYEGELLMFRSLLGDREAQQELSKRRELVKEKDRVSFTVREPDLSYRSEQELNLDDLVAVHATDFFPFVDKEGNVFIRPTFDNSGFAQARSTIHFTLNHHVVSHFAGIAGGHWENNVMLSWLP